MTKYFFKKDKCDITIALNNLDIDFSSILFNSDEGICIEVLSPLDEKQSQNMKNNLMCIGYIFDREETV